MADYESRQTYGEGRHAWEAGSAQGSARSDAGSAREPYDSARPGFNEGKHFPEHRSARGVYFPEVGNFALTGIPGYGGFVPGKRAENIIGATYSRSNQLSAVNVEERGMQGGVYSSYESQPENLAQYNPFGVTKAYRRGTDVPGYAGYVPGKYADGVFGHVFARANNISSLLKQKQYGDKRAWLKQMYE